MVRITGNGKHKYLLPTPSVAQVFSLQQLLVLLMCLAQGESQDLFDIVPFLFLFKKTAYLFCFLTLYLCLQHFHNIFMLLNKKSPFDPTMDTLGTHGTTIGPADMVLCLIQSHKDFMYYSTNFSKLA